MELLVATGHVLAFGPAITPWIIYNVQEEMPEGVLITIFVKCLANGHNLL